MVRMLFNLVLGIGLLLFQPTVLAGSCVTLVGLVCTGAFLKKEKSTCYTLEQNPIPFLRSVTRPRQKAPQHTATAPTHADAARFPLLVHPPRLPMVVGAAP